MWHALLRDTSFFELLSAWDQAVGDYRVLTTMAAELLAAAAERDSTQLDEKLYLEFFTPPGNDRPRRTTRGRRGR